ncbi:MAG: hypothetical protein GF411_11915 [Candidatus Lokiarchaeota archaeon]|nr:hypothetical protein [Candidatus Lokiarchaeota archaeon]
MATTNQILKGFLGHITLFFINFCVLVGVIESLQVPFDNIPFLNLFILGYMIGHTLILLSVQLGIQILELIRIRMPTFLPYYYFRIDDEDAIPIPLLDPTKSKLAVIILLLVIGGGPLIYPIFAIYGFFAVYAHLIAVVLTPQIITQYFGIFLNWMPPFIGIILLFIIISIVIMEFRHI